MGAQKEYKMLFQLDAQTGGSFNSTFSKAQQEINSMQKEIQELSRVQKDISAYQKQQSALEKTQLKLERLNEQYSNNQKELEEATKYSENLTKQINAEGNENSELQDKLRATNQHINELKNAQLQKNEAIRQTNTSLETQSNKLKNLSASLEEAGIDVNHLDTEFAELADEMNELKKAQEQVAEEAEEMGDSGTNAITAYQEVLVASGIQDKLKEIYEAFQECVDASVEFESAIAGVYKTVDGTNAELAEISDEVKALSTEIPATTTEIAAVAEAAGQLGIATGDVMEFTRVMIDLGESTNLSAEEAASSLAKFANITGTAAANYSSLGSVIVDLGNHFATTEADIVAMSTRLASAGTLAGLTEPEILALSAAMSSVGIEAEAGGTAMTQTLSSIETAVVNGGDTLEEFARIAGMSAEDFARAWETSPIVALQSFIAGLGSLEDQGESATLVLDELGLSGVRQSNMLKSLSLAADTLAGAVSTANNAWQDNVALTEEASKRYATTESQQAMLTNSYNNLKVAVGDNFTPALRELYSIGNDVLSSVTKFVEENPAVVKGVTATIGVVGAAGVVLAAYTAKVKLATTANELFKDSIPALKIIAGVTAGVAALAGAVVGLTSATDEEAEAVREMTAVSQKEYYQLQDLQAQYDALCEAEQGNTKEANTLKYQIDDLNASFSANSQTMEEYAAECQAVLDSYSKMMAGFEENDSAIEDSYSHTNGLIQKLSDLSSGDNKSAASLTAMRTVFDEINSSVEGLDLTYSDFLKDQSGSLQKIKEAVAAQHELEVEQEKYAQWIELCDEQLYQQEAVTKAVKETAAAQEIYNQAYEAYRNSLKSDPTGMMAMFDGTARALDDAKDGLQEAVDYQNQLEETAANTDAQIKEMEASWGFVKGAVEDNEDAVVSWEDASNLAFATVQSDMEALIQSYNDAYNAALESFEGQFGLFDKAKADTDATVANAQAALDSQLAYWQSYKSNVETLSSITAEQLGVTQETYSALMSYVQSGSTEAAGLAQSMVDAINNGNTQAITDLANTYGEVAATQQETADITAEWVTDFQGKMDELTTTMEETVAGLNLDEEAATAAAETIQAYADEILANKTSAVQAATNVVNAVAAALNSATINVKFNTSRAASAVGYDVDTYFADGTTNAPRGFAVVGEEGPEIVWFNGGEAVWNASETAALQEELQVNNAVQQLQVVAVAPQLISAMPGASNAVSAEIGTSGGDVSIGVTFQINGDVTAEAVEELEQYGDEFAERVRAVVEDALENQARRRY